MFGYVNVNKAELKVKDFVEYKAYYCGLCDILKNKYGIIGQMTLSYDMTFLIILLTSLYESDTKNNQIRCLVHPVKKHPTLSNEITAYVADMNIALSYHHLLDDWEDDKNAVALTGSQILKRHYKKIKQKYPRQCREMKENLDKLSAYENQKEEQIDLVAGCFGELMAGIFVYREDIWEESLRKIGFYMGKFIYILDAYDDIEKDMKNNNYNPLVTNWGKAGFEEDTKKLLTMMMAECTREFEQLPCLLDVDILRNILYDGVWTKFEQIAIRRSEKKGT